VGAVLLPEGPRVVSLLFVPVAAGAVLREPESPMDSQAARPSAARAPIATLNEVMTLS
jgi:hypothetical protein